MDVILRYLFTLPQGIQEDECWLVEKYDLYLVLLTLTDTDIDKEAPQVQETDYTSNQTHELSFIWPDRVVAMDSRPVLHALIGQLVQRITVA